MLPVTHPLAKTATEMRRAINRLHIFKEQHPDDAYVQTGKVDTLMNNLKQARSHIPSEMRDVDLIRE
jgi:hypothetical protein